MQKYKTPTGKRNATQSGRGKPDVPSISLCLTKLATLLAILCMAGNGVAQNVYSVSGTIYSPMDQQPLPGATAMALSVADSSMIAGTTTDPDGFFTLKNIPSGAYLLKVSYVGHSSMYKPFEVEGRSMGLGRMLLKERSTQLKAVEVVAERAEMKQQGDTTVYFGDAVNVGHGSTAGQLIGKMAGMKLQNGVLQAQGEDVVEILVDGQRFFEGDLETALKMLPAESVKNVEVYDYQSDRARLTGIDEGTGGKAINIVTQAGYEKSIFGRGYVGAGADGEYQGGGNLNLKNGSDRVSVLYQSNNINQQNFAQEDVSEVSGIQQNNTDGVSQIHAGGIDFASDMGQQTSVSGTYLFRQNKNTSQTELIREYLPDQGEALTYNESGTGNSTSYSHDLRLRVSNEMDPFNSVLFQPRLFVSSQKSGSSLNANSFLDQSLINNTSLSFGDNSGNTDFSAPVNFVHRFPKKGRTLSVDATPSYNFTSGENQLISASTFFSNSMANYDTIQQEGTLNSHIYRLRGGVRYTEPISKSSYLSLNYSANAEHSESEDKVFGGLSGLTERSWPDSLLSNSFESDRIEHKIVPGYLLKKGGHFLKVDLGYSWSQLQLRQQFPDDGAVVRQFDAVLPAITWRWRFAKSNRLRVSYHTSNRTPTAFQLQTVPNNTNPVRQYAGNADLQQEYRHSISANYNGINLDKGSVFLLGANFSRIQNFYGTTITTADSDTLINGRVELEKGGQLVRTDNLDGFFMAGVYGSYDNDINFLKSNYSIGINLNYTRMPGQINGANNWSKMPSAQIKLGLTSNVSERLDFEINTASGYETAFYTLQPTFNSRVFSQDTRIKLQWMAWKGFEINLDARHQLLRGQDDFFDTSILLCNAAIGYKFLKNKQAEFRLTVFDLFNNNDSVRRTINDLYTDTYRSNVLNRYAMLSFVYRLSALGGANP